MKFIPRSEATRQFIIESVAEVFNKKGFTGTSVTDLEKATGLTKGSIYGNFENKNAVAIAVFDYNLNIKLEFLAEQAARCSSYREKLLSHVLMHYPAAKAPFTPGGCPMQNTGIEAAFTNNELKKRAAEGLLRWTDILADMINKGIAAKEFKENTDMLSTALQIITMIEGGALFVLTTNDFKYGKKLLEAAQQIVVGICI